jgi:hypothetical protein
MTAPKLTHAKLRQFTGTENWYRHAINPAVLYTDGAKYLAEKAGAYWLLDEIALIQPYNKSVAAQKFQVWKLTVNADRAAALTCRGGNNNVIFRKQIDYTDFLDDRAICPDLQILSSP